MVVTAISSISGCIGGINILKQHVINVYQMACGGLISDMIIVLDDQNVCKNMQASSLKVMKRKHTMV
jgi:hypothetical protein